MALQVRRGLSSELTSSFVPAAGEPVLALDTGKLYVGDGSTGSDVLDPINKDLSTEDIANVSNTAPSDNQALIYNSSGSEYVPTDFELKQLGDVSISVSSSGDVIRYDGNFASPTFDQYISAPLGIEELSGVSVSSIADGDALIYNSTTSQWENQPVSGGGSTTLDGLTDVNAPSPSDGDVIAYDSLSSQWVSTAPSGGSTTLNGLTDVNLASPAGGDLLSYDSVAGEWVNSQFAAGLSTINDIYVGANATHEAVISNVTINFVNGFDGFNTLYSGISDNSFSTGASKECLTADGNGGLNWEQVLLENVASGTLQNAVDDTAAASAGVPIGGIYRDGSTLKVRVS